MNKIRFIACISLAITGSAFVATSQPAPIAQWKVSIDSTFRPTGDVNAPQTYVVGLAVSRSGRVFSLDYSSRSVQILGASGRVVRTVGRKGSGPGEFQSLGAIGSNEAGFWVTDPALDRITYFDENGNVERVVTISTVRLSSGGPKSHVIRPLGDGSIVYQTYSGTARQPMFANRLGAGALVRGDTTRLSADTLVQLPPLIGREYSQPSGARKQLISPLQALPAYAFTSDGFSFAIIEQPSILSISDTISITRRTIRGDSVMRSTLTLKRAPLGAALRESLAKNADNASSLDERREIEKLLSQVKFLPVLTKALASSDGSIWVNRFSSDNVGHWAVLSAIGKLIAEVHTPPRLQLFEVNRDLAWGVQYDSDDVPHIRRLKISRVR
jgi:hypothetical protein